MNYLWGGMIVAGIVYASFHGTLPAVTQAAIDSAKEAVTLCIAMAGVMSMWTGLMKIAEATGIIRSAEKLIRPFLHFLFPKIPKGHPANQYIAENCIANIFGLGWAATPAGLKAMKALQQLQEEQAGVRQGIASDEVCTFLILNISSLQLIPVNMIAYRSQYGSVNPTEIVGPAILATLCSTLAAVIYCKWKAFIKNE